MTAENSSLKNAIVSYKSRIETALADYLSKAEIQDKKLHDAMEYSLLFGGKRVRPFLVYATGQLFNVPIEDLDAVAASIEAIHSYSLVHDDLPAMDDDDLRRGHPTCHKAFDEATAILAGDTLQSFAFGLLAEHGYQSVSATQIVQLVRILAQAANSMCAGQSIDLQQTDSDDSRLESLDAVNQLKHMHSLKTGALIKVSVKMAAICGNANEKELALLTEYADKIGLAFQVWDDVLDIISDTDTLGKPQGSDVESNKMTYPALLGLEQARNKAQNLVNEAVQAVQQLPYNTELLTQLANYIIERDH